MNLVYENRHVEGKGGRRFIVCHCCEAGCDAELALETAYDKTAEKWKDKAWAHTVTRLTKLLSSKLDRALIAAGWTYHGNYKRFKCPLHRDRVVTREHIAEDTMGVGISKKNSDNSTDEIEKILADRNRKDTMERAGIVSIKPDTATILVSDIGTGKIIDVTPDEPIMPSLELAIMATPTREMRRKITDLLDIKYDIPHNQYNEDWSDHKIAQATHMPVEWVAKLRDELYGDGTKNRREVERERVREAKLKSLEERLNGAENRILDAITKYGDEVARIRADLTELMK